MFNLKFYYCTHCGNVVIKAADHRAPLTCCGERMVELVPGSTDAAVEKHVPVIAGDGQLVTVFVGEAAHPMAKDHYIEFIALETSAGVQLATLAPGDVPQATFALADGVEVVAAFAHCNKHGLWVAEA